MEPAGVSGSSQFGVNVDEFFFRSGGLADVAGFPVPLLEGGGDPVLSGEFFAEACPAYADPVFSEFLTEITCTA